MRAADRHREQVDDRPFTEADLNGPSVDEPFLRCQALAALVIDQARRDLRGQGAPFDRERNRAEARDFLTGATPEWRMSLEAWCGIMDMDVGRVIADAEAGCPEEVIGQSVRHHKRAVLPLLRPVARRTAATR